MYTDRTDSYPKALLPNGRFFCQITQKWQNQKTNGRRKKLAEFWQTVCQIHVNGRILAEFHDEKI